MLEQQQAWLVRGLQELYHRTRGSEGSTLAGDQLKIQQNGHPLTYDLLTRLGALDHTKGEYFEEGPDEIHQEPCPHGMKCQEPTDGSSEPEGGQSQHFTYIPPFQGQGIYTYD
ncbi:uncharacterized protein N7483_011103 [Penicillium malachiteum]|uniref:uncharacterized protein n=1 Tax=Penicillium malachiteum TaxID=1324776 RepID=UPI0025486A39|nr:uncharacterized protein N7483_011103 [Penicillium malachiteum]KAJ5713922.1 hypothetical protein N7483_011103 [Penicillium malachiteum]